MPYQVLQRTLFPVLRKFYKNCEGLENIPPAGPYLVVANHVGFIDYFFIASVINQHYSGFIHFISKSLFARDLIMRKLWGQIPIDPNNKERCLYEAWECLKKKEVVVIFPEGSASGNVTEFLPAKTGAAKLSLWSKVPVIPVFFQGPVREGKYFLSVRNIRSLFHFYKKSELIIGSPILLDEYYDRPLEKEILIEITRKIMKAIAALGGKKYLF